MSEESDDLSKPSALKTLEHPSAQESLGRQPVWRPRRSRGKPSLCEINPLKTLALLSVNQYTSLPNLGHQHTRINNISQRTSLPYSDHPFLSPPPTSTNTERTKQQHKPVHHKSKTCRHSPTFRLSFGSWCTHTSQSQPHRTTASGSSRMSNAPLLLSSSPANWSTTRSFQSGGQHGHQRTSCTFHRR